MQSGVVKRRSPYIGRGGVLSVFDPWGSELCTCPFKYSLQPYTGCSHQCLYCYATSYIRTRRSIPKKDFIKRLLLDLRKASPQVPVSMSNSSDPYPPEEREYKLTRRTLEVLLPRGYKVLIVTKGDLVARDIDLLSKGNVAVTMTITTLDRNLAKKIEPNAPSPSSRLEAVRKLIENNIPIGVRVDPIIPFLNDDPKMIEDLIDALASLGVKFIVTSTYKARPDNLKRMINAFPELASKFNRIYKVEGTWMHGYWYLSLSMRKKLLKPVIEAAKKSGLEYATCREGLTGREWFSAKSCDGTHLIPLRIKFPEANSLFGALEAKN